MRPVLYVLSFLAVLASAFWAYRENYATQGQLKHVAALQDEIATLRESIALQRAEWAYLNRPDRLRELATINFDRLGLLPMEPAQFGYTNQVAYPPPPERHSMQGARTRSVKSLSSCHCIGMLRGACTHEEISHPTVPQSFQHFTPWSFPCSVFCPLFLFQISLNYFFTKKYPISPPPHRFMIYASVPATLAPHTTAPQPPGPPPYLCFFVVPNYFKFR